MQDGFSNLAAQIDCRPVQHLEHILFARGLRLFLMAIESPVTQLIAFSNRILGAQAGN